MIMALKRQHETIGISTITEVIADIAAGRPVIMVDDESRENEGDIIIAAQAITAEWITFMIKQCGGIICLSLEPAMVERLALTMQPKRNTLPFQAPFTVSIEAKDGVSTGVSAADRVKTILDAIDPKTGPDDISTPGHVYPLCAQQGGVLDRAGHTEAALDLARLAGYSGAAVLCEIINPDGTMARLPDLILFSADHGLKIGTIADLIAYRKNHDASF